MITAGCSSRSRGTIPYSVSLPYHTPYLIYTIPRIPSIPYSVSHLYHTPYPIYTILRISSSTSSCLIHRLHTLSSQNDTFITHMAQQLEDKVLEFMNRKVCLSIIYIVCPNPSAPLRMRSEPPYHVYPSSRIIIP